MARRGTLCAVAVIGTMATACFLVGFIAPGWIVMTRSLEEIDIPMDLFMTQRQRQRMGLVDGDDIMDEQLVDEGDMIVDRKRRQEMPMEKDWIQDPEMGDHMRPGMDGERMHDEHRPWSGSSDSDSRRSHHGPRRHQDQRQPIDSGGLWPTPSEGSMEEWLIDFQAMNEIEMKEIHLHVSYGLWYSVYCAKVRDVTPDMSGEERHHGKKGKCSCLKLRTDHALNYAFFFESQPWGMMEYDQGHHRLSKRHMGGASLKEHQIESTIGVLFSLIGLIAGIVGFGKAKKCLQLLCALAMLLALTLFLVPSIRLAKFSHQKNNMHGGIHMKMPYSAVASLIGCLLAFVTLVIAMVSVVRKRGEEAPGQWNKFHNEFIPDLSSDLKKPALVFLNDPLPEKPGLYDVCDFSNIKPAEEYEPEEKPIA